MTIQEAVKSGKPFKRKKLDRWYDEIIDFDLNSGTGVSLSRNSFYLRGLKVADILADDWEIKEEQR